MLHGIAILAMVALHLFCRKENLPYNVYLFDNSATPILYYFGLFGDICVPIYCFTSGYAQQLLSNIEGRSYRNIRWKRLWMFINHFWLILLLFCAVGLIVHDTEMPGSLSKFLGNLFLYDLSYNGAWWFVSTYCFLIAGAPLIVTLVKNVNPWMLFFGVGAIYIFSYICYFDCEIFLGIAIVDWCIEQLLLLGRSLFSFIIGAIFCQHEVFYKIERTLHKNWMRRLAIWAVPMVLFLFHAKVQSLIVAPIVAMGCMCCFYLWKKPVWVKVCLSFLGRHSTNIWLTHMFFYLCLFKNFIFSLKVPLLIYIGMILICVFLSYAIQYIENIWGNAIKKVGLKRVDH